MNYEMTQEQLDTLLEAMKPVPYVDFGGGFPSARSQQDNANAAWKSLGKELGFDYTTVKPTGKGAKFFTAKPIGE